MQARRDWRTWALVLACALPLLGFWSTGLTDLDEGFYGAVVSDMIRNGDWITPTLNGQPLYEDYEMHFMVTQGIRDRTTLRVNYPMADKRSPAGEVNPATQQIDFYIRSPQQNPLNSPNRDVFMHFFGMEVTWK